MRLGASIERAHKQATPASFDQSSMDAALASRAFWKELCESVGDVMFETDRHGRFTFLAPNEVLGYEAHALVGHLSTDLLCTSAPTGVAVFNPFASPRPLRMHQAWLRRQNGSLALFAVSGHPITNGGMRGVAVDVTRTDDAARQAAEATLSRAMIDRIVDRLRDELLPPRMARAGLSELVHCLGTLGAAIAVMPTASAPDPHPRGEATTPSAAYIVGTGWDAFAPRLQARIETELPADRTLGSWRSEGVNLLVCSNLNRFGSPTVLVLWRRADQPDWSHTDRSVAAAVAKALRSVIEQDNIQRHMTDQARTDVLTGLLNRRSFCEEIQRRLDRLDGDGEPAVLLTLDLDDFHTINDQHGSDRGDDVLCQTAAILRDAVRPTDLVCRTVGDSFAIWLGGADLFAAAERAEALCRHGLSVVLDAEVCRSGLSVGLACRPANSLEDIESLFRRADVALMQSKRSGKGAWRASQEEIET